MFSLRSVVLIYRHIAAKFVIKSYTIGITSYTIGISLSGFSEKSTKTSKTIDKGEHMKVCAGHLPLLFSLRSVVLISQQHIAAKLNIKLN